MTMISEMRVMKAVWWKRGAVPDKGGEYTFDRAVEIDCFWTASNEQFNGSDGKPITASSVVYVDRMMSVGDCVKLCRLSTLTLEQRDSNDPERLGADEIRMFTDHPDWNNDEHLYMAVL